jgi:hypothetical protein
MLVVQKPRNPFVKKLVVVKQAPETEKLLGDKDKTFSGIHKVQPTAERLRNGKKGRTSVASIW